MKRKTNCHLYSSKPNHITLDILIAFQSSVVAFRCQPFSIVLDFHIHSTPISLQFFETFNKLIL